jgi:hypothetical protein
VLETQAVRAETLEQCRQRGLELAQQLQAWKFDPKARVEKGADIASRSVRVDGHWKSVHERKPSPPAEAASGTLPNTETAP